MSYGEQVLWVVRVLDNPEAASVALKEIEKFQHVFEELNAHHLPKDEAAARFYKDMLANVLTDYAFELRRN